MFSLTSSIIAFIICTGIISLIWKNFKPKVVAEDHVAVTENKDGFIKRILPPGRHILPPTEKIAFSLATKTKLASARVLAVSSSEGIHLTINWSGTYALRPELITESKSQRLRGLQNAELAINRNVDIYLRKLAGVYCARDLFNPAVRERLERQLSQTIADRLKPLGIGFNNLNLQAIELPSEVSEALNKAKAIETLDGAIRQLDPTTREVVRGVYQLDEILHWDAYLPVPSRHAMKQLEGHLS